MPSLPNGKAERERVAGGNSGVQYYNFTIDGKPVGYFEIDERPDEISMNARMVIGSKRQENPFTVRLKGGQPTLVRLGEAEWQPVPDGTYPTCAYSIVLRSGLPRYRAFIEGTGEIENREIRSEGGLLVEHANGKVARKFQMQAGRIMYICWGETAESRLVGSKSEAVRGTAFE